MAEYRNRTTGEIKSQEQLRGENPNISLPRVWNDNVHDALNVDPVLRSPKPTEGISAHQTVQRNGVIQDTKGNWVWAWEIVDRFSDYTDEEGVIHTKAEQETNHQAFLDSEEARRKRTERELKLAETDWWASVDLTMSEEQAAYRQALRDITNHENWPYLQEEDWPVKP